MDNVERRRLVSLIQESSVMLTPEPPELPPEMEALCGLKLPRKIRAVLFDVYGTLFCSAAGDIGVMSADTTGGNILLDELTAQYGMFGVDMHSWFREKAAELHRSAKTEWPEVCVDQIWGDRELALRYELSINPVYPMPGAAKTIAALQKMGCVLGIVSNAQFFTPLLFEAFFDNPPERLGFSSDLLIWSYEMGEAKPSPRLFEAAACRLQTRGIAANECVFVGNDMLSDMYGAINAGFQGILFAGDCRSLRLRQEDSRIQRLRPHVVVKNLEELVKIYAS